MILKATTNWRFIAGAEVQSAMAEIWSVYNKKLNDGHPSIDCRYLKLLYEYFGRGSELLAISDDAVALLQSDGLGRWSTFLPSQSCVGAALFSKSLASDDVSEICHSLSAALPGKTTLVSFRKQDSRIAQLQPRHIKESFITSTYGTTTDIDTSGSFEDYWQGRSKGLRQGMRRKIKRVEKDGLEFALSKCEQPGEMAAVLAEHAVLEMSGWKARSGTAISGTNQQSRFYEALMTTMSANGQAAAYQLILDNEVAASLLTIRKNETMIVLKIAYRESFSRFAPGRLLDYLMLQDVFGDSRTTVIENYTVSTMEDRRWCTGQRDIIDWDFFPSRVVREVVCASRRARNLLSRS